MTGRRKKPRWIPCSTHTTCVPSLFDISVEQVDVIKEWTRSHNVKKHGSHRRDAGSIGGAYTYELTPTSLGTVVVVRCCCGEAIDVSDYDSW